MICLDTIKSNIFRENDKIVFPEDKNLTHIPLKNKISLLMFLLSLLV